MAPNEISMGLLDNKVVLITGASRGIGKSIAEECVKQGAKVAFTYLSSEEKARALEAELTANGGVAKGFKSDAGNFEQAQKLVDDVVAEFGTIDVLVNNAGITRDTLLMRMTEEQWDEVINTNLKSAFNLTKAVQRPMLKARSGSIINMSSVVGVPRLIIVREDDGVPFAFQLEDFFGKIDSNHIGGKFRGNRRLLQYVADRAAIRRRPGLSRA